MKLMVPPVLATLSKGGSFVAESKQTSYMLQFQIND